MNRPRVDVVVPGAEGSWIARALRQAGYDVREADDTRGSADADAVVVDRAIDRFEDALRDLVAPRRVVVGWDPPSPEDAARWGADATFPRPVPVPRLLAALGETIGRPEPASRPATPPRTTLPAPPASPAAPTPPTREPTMHLEPAPGEREPTINLEVSLEPAEAATAPETGPSAAAGQTPSSSSEALSSAGIRVEFSGAITALLREADRRVFPNERPLDLRFPGGDEPADELVPDDLIAEVSMPLDVPDADPLDAFTFVGTPDLLGRDAERPRSQPPEATGEGTPRTVDDRPGRSPTSGSSASASIRSGVAREGMLPAAGAIRVLWQAQDEARPVRVRFEVAGGPTLTLTTHGGRLLSLEGPVHTRAAELLRQAGRLGTIPDDEESARALLHDETRYGRLDPFELARLLRTARESLIHDLAVAPEARFAIEPASSSGDGRPLVHGTVVAIACEGARRRATTEDVLRWLGFDPRGRLALSSRFAQRALDAGLEPELVEAFEAAADRAVGQLLGGAGALVGVAGALLTLASADAVRVKGEADSVEILANVARERILRAARLAREGDYFRILGVSPRASSREIDRARRDAVRELHGVDLAFLGLDNLEDLRREALVAIEEAAELLSDEDLRAAYARALERPALR